LPRANEIAIDARMLGFTALICLLATVAVGIAPAVRPPTADLSVPLKAGSPGAGASGIWLRLRSALVALEVALALVLLIGTGLLVRSLWALSHVDPGFDPKGVITFGVFPPPRYDAAERAVDLYQRVASAIASLPGAGEVALSNHVPLSGAYLPRPIEVPGRSPDPQGDPPVLFRTISAEYFDVMRIPVRKGRAFTATDIALGSRMAIINETLAHRFFPGQNPIGKFVTLFKSAQSRKDFGERFSVEIIGLVGDVRHTGLEDAPAPEVYIPYTVNPWGQMNVVVRTRGDPQAVLATIPRAVAAVDRDVPVTGLQRPGALTQAVSGQWARQRFTVTVLSGFAGGALLLSALGIFGVIAYVVTLRTREFGVRAALGATPRDIVRLVIRQTTGVVVVGLAVGFGAALALTRLMTRLLYNVPATDPLTFASLTVFLAVVALLASYLPARRASRVDPIVALRNE
jgi:putative ABC transport system permease protein